MTEQDLKILAQAYVEGKEQLDKLKKRIDKINLELKSAMESEKLDKVTTDTGAVVKCGITRKESFNEDMLISTLKRLSPDTECIKTKEYVDMDILEGEIYHGFISKNTLEEMDKCKAVKLIPTLTISKAKKGK